MNSKKMCTTRKQQPYNIQFAKETHHKPLSLCTYLLISFCVILLVLQSGCVITYRGQYRGRGVRGSHLAQSWVSHQAWAGGRRDSAPARWALRCSCVATAAVASQSVWSQPALSFQSASCNCATSTTCYWPSLSVPL